MEPLNFVRDQNAPLPEAERDKQFQALVTQVFSLAQTLPDLKGFSVTVLYEDGHKSTSINVDDAVDAMVMTNDNRRATLEYINQHLL